MNLAFDYVRRAALETLVDIFGDLILTDQDCFKKDEAWEELLELIPDKTVVAELRRKWNRDENRSSEDKWADLKAKVSGYDRKSPERV